MKTLNNVCRVFLFSLALLLTKPFAVQASDSIYAKALLDETSRGRVTAVMSQAWESNRRKNTEFAAAKIMPELDLHMTLVPIPSQRSAKELSDYANPKTNRYRKNKFESHVDNISKTISELSFKIKGTAVYRNYNFQYLVLELEALDGKKTKKLTGDTPHISLVRFTSKNKEETQSLHVLQTRVDQILQSKINKIVLRFDKVITDHYGAPIYTTGGPS